MEKTLLIPLDGVPWAENQLVMFTNRRQEPRSVRLLHDGQGRLTLSDTTDGRDPFSAGPSGLTLAGLLHWVRRNGVGHWYLLSCSQSVAVDDMAPPLPLVELAPGSVLSIGRHCWLIARLWFAQPAPVNKQLADKPCPVCGTALAAAPVIRCLCGRLTHLEHAGDPDDDQALNCFLASGTCDCGVEPVLEPQVFPKRARQLIPPHHSFEPQPQANILCSNHQ